MNDRLKQNKSIAVDSAANFEITTTRYGIFDCWIVNDLLLKMKSLMKISLIAQCSSLIAHCMAASDDKPSAKKRKTRQKMSKIVNASWVKFQGD